MTINMKNTDEEKELERIRNQEFLQYLADKEKDDDDWEDNEWDDYVEPEKVEQPVREHTDYDDGFPGFYDEEDEEFESNHYYPRPIKQDILHIDRDEPSGVKSLGEIFAKCKDFSGDAVFAIIVYDSEKKDFWFPQELIIGFKARIDEHKICAYSGYYDETPKHKVIKNTDFLIACDPKKTGNVDCIGCKNPLWVIDNDTPIYISTKMYRNLLISDVIPFEYNGIHYIGFIATHPVKSLSISEITENLLKDYYGNNSTDLKD